MTRYVDTNRLGLGQDHVPIALEKRIQAALAADVQVHVDTAIVMQHAT